jgi:hypothetical protein
MFPPLSNGIETTQVNSGSTIMSPSAFTSHKRRQSLKNKGQRFIFTKKAGSEPAFFRHRANLA